MGYEKVFFHVDLDAFYASVEQSDNPDYQGKPVIVGARPGHRGVVSACSYEARKFGVHSAMPISQAYRLCPRGIYVPPRMDRYQEVSQKVMSIFSHYSPEVQQISVDEAFMDMTGTRRLFGSPEEAARKIKNEVREKYNLVASIGIAPNKYLAKLASDYKKPDGLYRVYEDQIEPFLDTLELKDLWGIGAKTVEQFNKFHIVSVPQLRKFKVKDLQRMFGTSGGEYIYSIVRGKDPGIFKPVIDNPSISAERTFPNDINDYDYIKRMLLELSHLIMFRLQGMNTRAKTVFIKLKYADFTSVSAQYTCKHWISSAEEIYRFVLELLDKKWADRRLLRLIGCGVTSIEKKGSPKEQDLFESNFDKKSKVEKTVLSMNEKYKNKLLLTKASLVNKTK